MDGQLHLKWNALSKEGSDYRLENEQKHALEQQHHSATGAKPRPAWPPRQHLEELEKKCANSTDPHASRFSDGSSYATGP